MLEQVLKSYLEHICGKANVRENESMRAHTTFGIGGPAKFFVSVYKKDVLVRLVSALNYIEYPYKIIGTGSNLLVRDGGFDGVIIRLKTCEIVENGNIIYADAGAPLVSVVQKAAELGLSGLEFAYGIPGTVGGAVFGNAGAFGASIADVAVVIDVLKDGEIISMENKDCKFGYRTSYFQKNKDIVILGAYFSLQHGDSDKIKAKMQVNLGKRNLSQPAGKTAGCVFRNQPAVSAGEVIDRLGLKGFRIGGAVISEKHANFIVNDNHATAKDVEKLIRHIKKRASDTYGIKLKLEIEKL